MLRLLPGLFVITALSAFAAPSDLAAPTPAAKAPRRVADARVHLEGELSVPVPAGWHLSTHLTQLGAPTERFTLSSAPPARNRRVDSCGPLSAVQRLGRAEALAFVFEYEKPFRRSRFPPRPRRFRLPAIAPVSFECFGVGWLLAFREEGRAFQVMVALGSSARGTEVERRLLSALSRLVVLPRSGE